MRRVLLTTASAVAITLGGAGLALAAGTTSQTGATAPSHTGSAAQGMGSHGMQGTAAQSEVKQAQQQLQSEGLYHGQIDGIVGPKTREAVSQYQKKAGLRETAKLDQETMSHLLGGQTTGSGSSGSPQHGTMPATGGASGSGTSGKTTQ